MAMNNPLTVCKSSCKDEHEISCIVSRLHDKISSGELGPGDKLQNERLLAASYGTTVHTIRKTLKVLREEGVVYSRPKVGVFVSEPQCGYPEDAGLASLYAPAGRSRLHFVTKSGLASQTRVLKQAIQSFQQREPGCELSVHLQSENEELGDALLSTADMVESCTPFFYHRLRDNTVDMEKYFSSVLQISETDSHSVPFCYSTVYVCYREELLSHLGFAAPGWRSYEEQTEYLDAVTSRLVAHGLSLPGTCFSALELLDSSLPGILRDFRDSAVDEVAFIGRYASRIEACTGYWRRYQISFPRQAEWHMREFMEGKSPLFFTNSATVLELRERCPELSFQAYPYLSVEGRLPRLTVPLSILDHTSHLVECARFFRELQSEPVQAGMASLGYVPIHDSCYAFLPESSRGFSGGVPFFLVTPEDFYLCLNILNVELWNIILFDKDVQEALRDSLVFARAYLDFQLDGKGRKNREEHGRMYL